MFKVMNHDPLPPSQVDEAGRPAGYDAIVAKALARDPGSRYASAAEFRRALAQRLQPSMEAGSGITDMPTLLRRLPKGGPAAGGADGPTAMPSSGRSQAQPQTGHTGASTALVPTGWNVDVLAPVERALASVVGPMAKVMVRQAARQATDLPALTQVLLQQIPNEVDRGRFLSRLEAGTTHLTRTSLSSGGTSASASSASAAGGSGGQGIGEALNAHALKVLTRHLGPIAKILVKKAAAQTSNPTRFVELLADMADGVDRTRLLRELQAPH